MAISKTSKNQQFSWENYQKTSGYKSIFFENQGSMLNLTFK
jgi:hypothetical protein